MTFTFTFTIQDPNLRFLYLLVTYSILLLFKLELFHLPTLIHNSLFISNMYVTLLSSTCFEH